MHDIIIIGAGPAGLTAAIYALRAAKKVLILEAKSYGGQIINTPDIENYPTYDHISGFDFATKLYKQVEELGAEIIFEEALGVEDDGDMKKIKTEDGEYTAKAIILANGLENRKLGLPNEEELIGKGVSYCATCDGAFYKGKKVAVVGGGNTALEDALYLSDIADKVYLIHRRGGFRGFETTVEQLKSKQNVEFVLDSNVAKLNGSERLENIEVSNKNGDTRSIDVDGIFIAIGKEPKNDHFVGIKLDDGGYVMAGEDCHTNIQGVFVAGDSRTKDVRQLVTATSDGAIAAEEAVKYINRE